MQGPRGHTEKQFNSLGLRPQVGSFVGDMSMCSQGGTSVQTQVLACKERGELYLPTLGTRGGFVEKVGCEHRLAPRGGCSPHAVSAPADPVVLAVV